MLREKTIIHIGKNVFPKVENNILEVTKVVSFEKKVRKHGCTFILEIIFFLRMKIRFLFIVSVSFNMYFHVLISLLIAVLVLSFFVLFIS